ncbi:putative ATP-dependent DNA helicase Q1 [Oscarella lobularis]|uniref:putative ATP-dependent DNA helicase Q1 n=1 Tax=Oscarella lobularis TaxID=121494 RepID=UPI00331376B2
MNGKDTIVRLGTNGGKSLCYQLPPQLFERPCCLVVSPLTAVMDEQVEFLSSLNLFATRFILPIHVLDMPEELLKKCQYSVSQEWMTVMKAGLCARLNLIAIDEAHCVTEWGNDFRTAYRKLKSLRAYSSCPVMALTATATRSTMSTIRGRAGINNPATLQPIKKGLQERKVAKTILYVQTKNLATCFWDMLRCHGNVAIHHSSLDPSTRREAADKFRDGEVSVIISTIGFGMGINIPDVRLVVSCGLPSSVAQLFQIDVVNILHYATSLVVNISFSVHFIVHQKIFG